MCIVFYFDRNTIIQDESRPISPSEIARSSFVVWKHGSSMYEELYDEEKQQLIRTL